MTYTVEFENFWKEYPVKIEKKYAFKCYQKAIRGGSTPQSIHDGLVKYKKWLSSGSDNVWRPNPKNPSTWLNKGCWEDDYEVIDVSKVSDPVTDRWKARMISWKTKGWWSSTWGPRPDEPNCECPKFLL